MPSIQSMKKNMGLVLTMGTIVSAMLVLVGGSGYLLQHGGDELQMALLQPALRNTRIIPIWRSFLAFSPIGMMGLGLFILVGTQLLRVALLAVFYCRTKDYVFMAISSFILFVLFCSII